MSERLTRLRIAGYRSLRDVTVELGPLNVLIGANGAGKSNVISFFKLLNEMMAGRLQQHIGISGRAQSLLHFGPKHTSCLEAVLDLETDAGARISHTMRLSPGDGDTLAFTQEILSGGANGPAPTLPVDLGQGHGETRLRATADAGNEPARSVRRLLDACHVYHFHDTSQLAAPRRAAYLQDNHVLRHDAGNLASMLFAYRARSPVVYRRIVSTLRQVMVEFDDFVLDPGGVNPNEIFLNWRAKGQDYVFGPHQLSDGSLRAMALMTLLLQPEAEQPALMVLDEPELGLHPYALAIVAGLVQAAAVGSQVIVATQSPAFVDHFRASEVLVVDSQAHASRLRRLDDAELAGWLEDYSLGELWERNVFGAGPMP